MSERKAMIRKKIKKTFGIIGMVIGGIALALLCTFGIMWLWNWLMPMLFGLTTITYWQGLGLAVLGRLLMGGFGGGGGGGRHKDCDDECHPVRAEFKKEFKKEFDKEFDKTYDEWWENQGKESYEAYSKDNCCDE